MKTVQIYLGAILVTTVNNIHSLEKTFENELLLKNEKEETIAYFGVQGYSYVVLEDLKTKPFSLPE